MIMESPTELAAEWTGDCANRLSDNSVRNYKLAAREFIKWLGSDDFDGLSRASVRRFQTWLKDRGLAPKTRMTYLIAIKSWCSWLTAEGYLESNPLTGLKGPKITAKPVDPYTTAEVEAMLEACGRSGFLARRNRAILTMFLYTGMRLHELAAIKLANVDLDNRVILLETTKGGRVRTVPIAPELYKALRRYFTQRDRHRYADSEYLWLSTRNPFLKKWAIDDMIRTTAKRAGIKDARRTASATPQ